MRKHISWRVSSVALLIREKAEVVSNKVWSRRINKFIDFHATDRRKRLHGITRSREIDRGVAIKKITTYMAGRSA